MAKDIGIKAIHVGKTVAIDAGKKLVEKAAKKLYTPKSQVANIMVPPEEITKKVNKVIAKYIDTSAININKLIDGSSVNHPNASTTAGKADNNGFAARHAYLMQSPNIKVTFCFRISLKHIFGFCEDYDKIVYGLKHNLTLVRKTDDDAIISG